MAANFDLYPTFLFRLTWNGRAVAAISKVSGLVDPRPGVPVPAGDDATELRSAPGQNGFKPIRLERGVIGDSDFELWASAAWGFGDSGSGGAQSGLRKDLGLELYDLAGRKVAAYLLRGCWPSEYTAISVLDGGANGVALESLTLQNEGWERDATAGGA